MATLSIDRTTSVSVSGQDYEGYLDGLDAGSWFSPDFTGEHIPTLAEALQTI